MGNQVDQLDVAQLIGLVHTRVAGAGLGPPRYAVVQSAGMTRTRVFGSGATRVNSIIELPGQAVVRTRAFGDSNAVWSSGSYVAAFSDDPTTKGFAIQDFGDETQRVLDVSPIGDIGISGNLTVAQGQTVAAGDYVFGSGGRLDGEDFIELVPGTGSVTTSRIQLQTRRQAAVSTATATAWSPATVAGHMLICAFHWDDPTKLITTPPSGWTLISDPDSVGDEMVVYYKVAAGSDAAPSIVYSGTANVISFAAEYSGVTGFDVEQNRSSSTLDTNVSASGAAVSTVASELWVMVLGTKAGGVLSAPTQGFTLVDQTGTTDSAGFFEKQVSATGALKGAATAATATYSVGLIATFPLAASGVVGTPASTKLRVYARVTGGVSNLYWRDDAGVEHSLNTLQQRTLYLPAKVFTVDGGTATALGASPALSDSIKLANAATQGMYTTFAMPADAVTGTTFTVRPIWSPSATDSTAHRIRWSMTLRALGGNDVTSAGSTLTWNGTQAARTVNVQVVDAGQGSSGVSPAVGEQVRFELQRIGADAADTYVGDANVLGVYIDYVSAT